jgi:class 3 adenylate cyclase
LMADQGFRKVQKKANSSRRKSMILRVQREPTTQTSSRSLNRLKGIRRFKQSSDILNSEVSAGMSTCQSLHTSQLVSVRKSIDIKENVKIPKGKVSIVITDIQGSTRMWEQNAPAMKDALDIHDAIIRKCYAKQSGYEITTEGDSFHLAFHHPLDALSFCLDCQQCLYNADWSDDILELSNAKFIPEQLVRGLRVRMGVHCGPSTSDIHEVTRRIYYNGEALELAKSMERASYGGQIITNVETWREVSGMAERYLGKPQVLDLGVHELEGKGETIYTRSLVQLVPKQYAFDYCTFRGTALNRDDQRPEGRTFPPPKTAAQTCAAFFDAPYLNNKVTMIFVNTTLVEEAINKQDIPKYSKNLAKIIRGLLIRTNPPGYECQEDNGNWMLAFHSLETAILFGLNLVARIKIARFPLLSKIGVQSGTFTSMGPHAITGENCLPQNNTYIIA